MNRIMTDKIPERGSECVYGKTDVKLVEDHVSYPYMNLVRCACTSCEWKIKHNPNGPKNGKNECSIDQGKECEYLKLV